MRVAEVPRADGGKDSYLCYYFNEFPYDQLDTKAINCKHKSKNKPSQYCYTFATFDIETTSVLDVEKPFGFMYFWQMVVGGIPVYGRYWFEWIYFLHKLEDYLQVTKDRQLVIYVFNLAFEFQFIRDFLNRDFEGFSVFATAERKPLHVTTETGINFRCAYRLTNMSLAKAIENEKGCLHRKASGDLDYKIFRLPSSDVNDIEFGYNMADVIAFYEMMECRLKNDHDNLESIPMTSTGYVRRDCRRACRKDRSYFKHFQNQEMGVEVYTMLKEAARGGDTHTNRVLAGKVCYNCDSFDYISDYPFQMLAKDFPCTAFTRYGDVEDDDELEDLLNTKACLFRVILTGLQIKKRYAMPYIPDAKLWSKSKHIYLDNGRVLSTISLDDPEDRGFMAMTVTDIDWKIIREQYDFDEYYIKDMHTAEYGPMPQPIRETVYKYFEQKTTLKIEREYIEKQLETASKKEAKILKERLEDVEYRYAKSKNLLNSLFGMAYTDPVHQEIYIDEDNKWKTKPGDIEAKLKKYFRNRSNFTVYAIGVWVTARAREALAELVEATGQENTIYCDTDSSKAFNPDFEAIDRLNDKLRRIAEERGAYIDIEGNRYYLGLVDHENKKPIDKFKALGAKKYCYEDDKGLHVTVSGVNKKKAPEELKTIENFKPGFIFREAGGTTLYYNDSPEGIHKLTYGETVFETGCSIAIADSTYTLGVTPEYADLIGISLEEYVDFM